MKKNLLIGAGFCSLLLLLSVSAFAQANCTLLQANTINAVTAPKVSYLSGLMELPFLFISVFFAFATASALKGGKFGKGMNLIAWGFVVMAVGHMHMQAEHYYGFNLFKYLLGEVGGTLAWFAALIVTWGLSGLGFYSMLKASRGK